MVLIPVASFVLFWDSQAGRASGLANAACARGQGLRLHYLLSGIYVGSSGRRARAPRGRSN